MKKVILSFIIIATCVANLSAQSDKANSSLEVTLAPELAFPYLFWHSENTEELPAFGGGLGVGTAISIGERMEIYGGIRYTLSGFARKTTNLVGWHQGQLDTTVYLAKSRDIDHHLSAILSFRYYYLTGKLSVFQSLGIQPNYFFRRNITWKSIEPEGDRSWTLDDIVETYVFANGRVGIGLKYQLNSKNYVSAEPLFRYAFWNPPHAPVGMSSKPPIAVELNLAFGFGL